MYIQAETNLPKRQSKDDSSCNILGREDRFASSHTWDETLKFLPSEKAISAAEYTSWHALVRAQLALPDHSNDVATRDINFQLARSSFDEIGKVHRSLQGTGSAGYTEQIGITSEQAQKLKELHVAATYMPKELAHEILGFTARRRKEEQQMGLCAILFFLLLMTVLAILYVVDVLLKWVRIRYQLWI